MYTHTLPLKEKNSGLVLLPFCSKIKILLPKNKIKTEFFFSRTVMLQNVSSFIYYWMSASKPICMSQAPPQSDNCNSISWHTYNQEKKLHKILVRSANVTSFMEFQYLQTIILDFSYIQAILHCKTTPSAQFLNFPLISAFMKNSF